MGVSVPVCQKQLPAIPARNEVEKSAKPEQQMSHKTKSRRKSSLEVL